MTDTGTTGTVRAETYGHILKIVIDNVAKRNAFSPEMMQELSRALTNPS
jgi:enoyl-CoA hydratase